ncbi:MAG: hypothetical protein HDQ96_00580 [Lachnospiraceae bacterium]|nr:hypothetical protein [Lachnospiraceae bacterium]
MDENKAVNQLTSRGGKLCTLDEGIGILNAFRAEHHRCETNCYVPMPALEEYIKEEELYLKPQESGIYAGVRESSRTGRDG